MKKVIKKDDIYEGMDPRKKKKLVNQENFLSGVREKGTIKYGVWKAEITRDTYHNWMQTEIDFPDRMAEARQEFAETLEEAVVGIVMDPDKIMKAQVLASTLLNANWPAKYRPQVTMDQDSAREVLNEMKRWRKEGIVESGGVTDLSPPVEKQLSDILDKRGSAPKEKEEG